MDRSQDRLATYRDLALGPCAEPVVVLGAAATVAGLAASTVSSCPRPRTPSVDQARTHRECVRLVRELRRAVASRDVTRARVLVHRAPRAVDAWIAAHPVEPGDDDAATVAAPADR